MIISHKYKFIFIKTRKTAGSSIQQYLSQYCGTNDIITPMDMPESDYHPRNYRGFFNPLPALFVRGKNIHKIKELLWRLITLKKYTSHIPAMELMKIIPKKTWGEYYKFCVERNPWDKVLSHYHFERQRYKKYDEDISFDEYLSVAELPYDYRRYTNFTGEIIVDRVLKYENLNKELAEVFEQLGIPFNGTLSSNEKSHYRKDRRTYKAIYTPAQREIVHKLFKTEINLHGYAF